MKIFYQLMPTVCEMEPKGYELLKIETKINVLEKELSILSKDLRKPNDSTPPSRGGGHWAAAPAGLSSSECSLDECRNAAIY